MDKIDSFVITGKQIGGNMDFTFILSEDDIDEKYSGMIIDYIEYLTHKLNKKVPQFSFTWDVAHKTKPEKLIEEIIHQILVQK